MEASILSRLPPELRDLVYECVFSSKYATKLEHGAIQHPLTKTCGQIRAETLPIYYALTRFNAHLDDGPLTPLVAWLKTLGAEQSLRLREVNVWDLHNLIGTLHGQASVERMLSSELEGGEKYTLGPEEVAWYEPWYFNDVIDALRAMGLGMRTFCTVESVTSHYAIVPLDDPPTAPYDCADGIKS